jgi:hypothetical protein
MALLGGKAPSLPSAPPNSFTFEHVNADGGPARWNPCAPIHYVVNPTNMPTDAMATLAQALADVTAATGITFANDGATTEGPDAHRAALQPSRYGNRWAPVLVAWENKPNQSNVPFPDGGVGVGYWMAAFDAVNPAPSMVTGQIVIMTASGVAPGFDGFHSYGTVLLHEWGHVLGLGHPADPNQVMSLDLANLSVAPGYQAGDLAGLARLGSVAGCLGTPAPMPLTL